MSLEKQSDSYISETDDGFVYRLPLVNSSRGCFWQCANASDTRLCALCCSITNVSFWNVFKYVLRCLSHESRPVFTFLCILQRPFELWTLVRSSYKIILAYLFVDVKGIIKICFRNRTLYSCIWKLTFHLFPDVA